MKRAVVVLTLAIGLVGVLPSHANPALTNVCTWKSIAVTEEYLTFDAAITAGPLHADDPATSHTAVTCEIRVNDPEARGQRVTSVTPGPVGFMTAVAAIISDDLTAGDEVWLCTNTYTPRSGTTVDYGCSYAFTY